VRSTAAPYTESRLTHLVRNKCVGFPVVEHLVFFKNTLYLYNIFSEMRNQVGYNNDRL
jgi:hypothetical protein